MDAIARCDCPADKPVQRDTDGLCFRCSGKLPLTAAEVSSWAQLPEVKAAIRIPGGRR